MADGFISVGSLTEDDLDLARKAGIDLSGYLPEDAVTRENYRAITPEDTSVGLSDVGRAIGAGAAGVASSLGGATEYITGGAYGGDTRRYFEEVAREQVTGMSPYSRRAFQAEFLPEPGGASVLDNLSASLGLKTVAAIPSVVSSIIPAGLAVKALSGFGTAVRAGAATAAARGTAGTLTGGEIASQVYSSIEKLGDQELQGMSPVYAGYRSMMDEAEARRLFMQDVAGAAPVVGFALSAATGGIESQVARRLGGEAAKGFVRGAAKGAGAEALQESLESGGGELLAQLQLSDANLAQMNWRKILSQTIEGGVLGAAIGAPIGGVSGMGRGAGQVQETPDLGPDPAQAAALTPEVTPAPTTAPAPAPVAAAEPAPTPAPVAAPAPAPTPAPTKREPTVLETNRTLEEQVRDLEDNIRPVALFPVGTKVADRPPLPEGMRLATVKGLGVVYYNPTTGLVGKDFQSMDEATLGKLLNMSGTTKDDVLAAVGRGAQPAVVTARRGTTPVVDQVTSTETLAQDAAAVAAKARPGDVVEVRTPEAVVAERQAPQRLLVRPSAPRTIRGEGTYITPEMRRAYAEEMTRVDAQGRRMLPDMSDAAVRAFYEARSADRRAAEAAAASEQARTARAAQQELDAQRQAAAEAEAPKAPIVAAPQKKGKAYQARVDNAQKIIETNQPSDVERAGFTSGATAGDRVKARTALLNRLDKIISQARAQKIAIPKRWKDGTPDYLGWLRAVADAKAGIEKGEATSTIIDRFLADEFYVSQGDFGAVKARRRGEAKGRFQKGEVREDQQREEAAMGGEEEPLGRVREATIEEEASPTEIYEQSAIAEEEEKAPTYEQARERAPVVTSTNELLGEVVTQGRSKEGEFKVERKGEGLRPKVEGKISLKPKAPKEEPLSLTPNERTELVNDYLWGNGGSNREIVDAFTLRTGTVAEMTRAVKIADLARSVISNKFGRVDQKLQRALAPQMLRALRQSVPNVEVRVIADEGFALIAPENTLGFYFPGSDMIVLPERAFSDPKVFAWVIAHEAAHAAFYKAVRANPALRNQVVKLMEHVRSMSALTVTRGEAFAKEAPIKYGFKNVDEFLAEAWSNPAFQRLLASTPIPTELATALGVRPAQRSMIRSLWDWLRFKVANVLGLPPNTLNAFDAVMRISEDLRRIGAEVRAEGAAVEGGPAFLEMPRVTQQTMQDLSTNLGGKVRRFKSLLKTMTMNARDMVDGLWKGTDAPLRAAKLRRAMDVMQADILERVGGSKLIEDHAALQREKPELYVRMADLGYRYTVLDANPGGVEANKHMGNKRKYIQARGQLAELDAEFEKIRALNPQYTDLLVRTSNTFKSIQNDVALREIKNILSKVGVDEPGLAERIHADGLTETDEAKFKTNATVQALKDARAFKKINGIYLPEMRRGDFVVNGRIDLEKYAPKTAIQLDQDTLLFTGNGDLKQAEKDASAFLKGTELTQTSARQIYVDKNDPLTELEKEDVDAVPALRVRVQTQFTSFVETEAEAKRLVDDMKADGTLDARYQVKREAIGARSNVVSADMKRIESAMKRSEKFKDLSNGEQSTTLQALRELGLRLDGDGRLGHRRMYRRNVAGFSMDLLANTQTYLDQAAGYLARLEYQPKIDAAVDEMDRFMQERKDISTADAAKMREQYAVLVDRLYQVNLPQTGTANNIVRRVLQISMLNKLAGISYNVVNAHEPWILGLPYLSGRFNPAEVTKAMSSAYRTLGVGGALGRGIYDMARAFKQDRGFTNFQNYFVERYSATGANPEAVSRVSDLFSYLHETGLFDREAGMEVTRVSDPTSNVLGRGLDRAELMFRQVASTVEAINRAVVATAAYELEYKRTGNHEAAKNYAYDAVHDTMGDYSAINASPLFNHPVGRLALQFKKFAQKTYWLLGRTVAHMFKGDREAMRQFAGLMFTTALVSGILGLPLEPIKIALLASGALLGTGFSYDDFEDLVRRTAAGMFGVKGGEVFTRGMYRMIDVEVANRMGLDSLLTFGQPRSQSQQDLKAWLFDTAGGAPAATIISQIASLNTLIGAKSNDDVLKALEQSMVPKAVVDITKAYRGYTVGKESISGRQTLEPYSLTEAAARAVGFTPAREAEQQRLRASVTDKDKQQQSERTKFNQQWYKAGPADRAKLWGQIEKWNKDRPKEARITRASLDAYIKRRNTEEESGSVVNGIRVNKNTRNFFEEGQRTYNVTR